MSEEKFFEEDPLAEDQSLDSLIQSTKEELESGAPIGFEPSIPSEYADLLQEEEEEEEESAPLPGAVKGLLYVCCVLTAAILLAVFGWKCADEVLALTAEDRVITVTVGENSTMSQVTDQLKDKGLIRYRWLFNLYCMVSNAEEKIKPGTYELNEQFDYHALIYGMMARSENRATVSITVPEGYEAEDIFKMLEDNKVCSVEKLEDAAANYEFDFWFLKDLEYGDYRRLEGYLFPDTYEFYLDDEPQNVLKRFLRNFDNKFTEEMKQDLDALNQELRQSMEAEGYSEAEIEARMLSVHDVVIVASLVEKETSGVAESGKIASVIYNRLCSKTYPCLNIDATIQYVLPERKKILTNADKAIISPYNTYTNAGLPVGPIANPGVASLRAALHPADTNYYFYAINPKGGHYFSENVYEHQAVLDMLSGKNEEKPEDTEEAAPQEVPNEQ